MNPYKKRLPIVVLALVTLNNLLVVSCIAGSTTSSLSSPTDDSGSQTTAQLAGRRTLDTPLAAMAQDVDPSPAVSVSATGTPNVWVVVDNSSYLLPVTFDWKIGSSHQLTATAVFYPRNGTRALFEGWSGSMTSSSPMVRVTVGANFQLTAEYKVEYLSKILFTDFRGKPVEVQDVVLKGPSGVTPLPPNDTVWLDAGATYSIWKASLLGVNVAPAGLFTVGSPSIHSFSLPVYAQIIRVQDIFGLPIQGANVTLVSNGDIALTKVTDNNGRAEFNQVPLGAFSARISYLSLSTAISVQTIGPHEVTVTMALSYPLLSLVSIIGALLAIEAIRRKRRLDADARFFRS